MQLSYAAQRGNGHPVMVQNPPLPAMSPYLAKLYDQFYCRKVWLEYFVFSAVWNPIPGSSTQQQTVTIDPSIDFICQQLNAAIYPAAGGAIVSAPNMLLEVTERSGNTNWADGPIHISNWTGQCRQQSLPYYLPFERYIRGNNTLSLKMTNLDATAYRVDLSFNGVRATYLEVSREALFGVPF